MSNIFNLISNNLKNQKLKITYKDFKRPWGGFFNIDKKDLQNFLSIYFAGLNKKKLKLSEKISLKILVILPNKRLSWQYHNRRSEIWNIFRGNVKVITSHDDEERNTTLLKEGDQFEIYRGERHRIIGLNNHAIIAEIWIHSYENNLSNEDDIVRIKDHYGR